jgi:predicted nucleic acid-binding protein
MRQEEAHVEEALQILNVFSEGEAQCYQPPHFVAEVMGVLTRLRPEKAQANLRDLLNMDFQNVEMTAVYATACELSMELKHHIFDTLYHAVALNTPGAILVTADEAYYRKAQSIGRILRLQDYAA